MESIGNARSFLSAAREVALRKPIIVIKVGRTEAAAKAVTSHTGTLTGNDDVLDAAFRRVGVLRVDTIEDLFDMAEVLGKQPRPKGMSPGGRYERRRTRCVGHGYAGERRRKNRAIVRTQLSEAERAAAQILEQKQPGRCAWRCEH